MDPKLNEILKKILSSRELVEETHNSEGEFYFRFKGIAMSILRAVNRDKKYGPYSFFIYPKWKGTLSELAHLSSLGHMDEDALDMISYHSGEYQNTQTYEYFDILYNFLKIKYTNVNLDELYRRILE